MREYAENGRRILNPTVLSENRLLDHRVSDVRCRVVHAPYPLSYPVPPTVTVEDNMQESFKRSKDMMKLWLEVLKEGSFFTRTLSLLPSPGFPE